MFEGIEFKTPKKLDVQTTDKPHCIIAKLGKNLTLSLNMEASRIASYIMPDYNSLTVKVATTETGNLISIEPCQNFDKKPSKGGKLKVTVSALSDMFKSEHISTRLKLVEHDRMLVCDLRNINNRG